VEQAVAEDNMALENLVRVRLTEGQMLVYAAQAEQRGVPISTYLRDRLAEADTVNRDIESIRAAMIDMGEMLDELRDQRVNAGKSGSAPVQPEPAIPNAVQIETLMMLREMASPQQMRLVWGELDRQDIKPWRGKVR
jgi:hypothetical protein